ncbi:hypothetical protein E2562_020167 [Oryza meyeriana var. granulata]|uniref:Uncharacterized protein n=1 Tax=Oryza meyeriana var. granulata TaxID=110450 RepID=A0A6G1BLW0_9ORYZ|nr:hypothetical protein E2562_020167 [Oryza meyeriana var. granulata]
MATPPPQLRAVVQSAALQNEVLYPFTKGVIKKEEEKQGASLWLLAPLKPMSCRGKSLLTGAGHN